MAPPTLQLPRTLLELPLPSSTSQFSTTAVWPGRTSMAPSITSVITSPNAPHSDHTGLLAGPQTQQTGLRGSILALLSSWNTFPPDVYLTHLLQVSLHLSFSLWSLRLTTLLLSMTCPHYVLPGSLSSLVLLFIVPMALLPSNTLYVYWLITFIFWSISLNTRTKILDCLCPLIQPQFLEHCMLHSRCSVNIVE